MVPRSTLCLNWMRRSIVSILASKEVPFGVQVSFYHEGEVEDNPMALYNMKWADQKLGSTWMVNLDHQFPRMTHNGCP